MTRPRIDPSDPMGVRGKRFYAIVGTQLPTPDDPASYDASAIIEVPTVDDAVAIFVKERMIGDLYEVVGSEYAGWHNFVQGYAPAQVRLPRPTTGRHLGCLDV